MGGAGAGERVWLANQEIGPAWAGRSCLNSCTRGVALFGGERFPFCKHCISHCIPPKNGELTMARTIRLKNTLC